MFVVCLNQSDLVKSFIIIISKIILIWLQLVLPPSSLQAPLAVAFLSSVPHAIGLINFPFVPNSSHSPCARFPCARFPYASYFFLSL